MIAGLRLALSIASGKFTSIAAVAIVADAAYAILNRDSRRATGNFYIDEAVLREEGVTQFDQYAVTPGARLYPDLFLD